MENTTLTVWMNLLGFDKNDPDSGAERFLKTTGVKPDAICALLCHADFFNLYGGMEEEYVLPPDNCAYFGIPRKDTNNIAHELINTFGSYAGVFEANRHDLMKVKGMTETAACLIKMIVPFYSRYIENLYKREPSSIEPADVVEYLRPKYHEGCCRERVFFVYIK